MKKARTEIANNARSTCGEVRWRDLERSLKLAARRRGARNRFDSPEPPSSRAERRGSALWPSPSPYPLAKRHTTSFRSLAVKSPLDPIFATFRDRARQKTRLFRRGVNARAPASGIGLPSSLVCSRRVASPRHESPIRGEHLRRSIGGPLGLSDTNPDSTLTSGPPFCDNTARSVLPSPFRSRRAHRALSCPA